MAEAAGLRRGIAALAVLAFVVALTTVGVAVYSAMRAQNATAERGTRLDPAAATAALLLADYVDQGDSLSGYLITADPAFLDSFNRATASIPVHFRHLGTLLRDHEPQLVKLYEVADAHRAWLSTVVQPELDAMARGDVDAARAVERDPRTHTRSRELRLRVTSLEKAIASEQVSISGRVSGAQDLLLSSLGTAVLLVATIVVTLSVVVRRWLLRPIAALRQAVIAVAAGRYDTRIAAVGPKELVELAAHVEAMRAQLVRLVRQNDRSWEALAQEGPAVIALRDALTPSTLHASGLVVRGRVDPAEGELAGDWFDSIDLPGGRVGVVVGDVSGHGAAAGVYALRLKQLLGAALTTGELEPGAAIEWVVDNLGDTDEVFATAMVVVVDPGTGTAGYANAGHPEGLLLRRSASPGAGGGAGPGAADQQSGTGPALAVAPRGTGQASREVLAVPRQGLKNPGESGSSRSPAVVTLGPTGPVVSNLLAAPGAWRTVTVHLDPGDALFIYTDGLTEARDERGEQFGEDRLLAEILRDLSREPTQLLDSVFEAVRSHAPGRPSDDRTAIILARTPKDES